MTFDAAHLNRRAIREALEFVAAHQDEINKAAQVASLPATQRVLSEAERVRAQLVGAADRAAKAGLGSAQEQVARQAAAQLEYVRRAAAPLSVDQLSRELAWVLRSDSTDRAKLLATEIVQEQAELRAAREKHPPAPNRGLAQHLLAQAQRTLKDAQAVAGEPEADPPEPAAPPESAPHSGADVPSEGAQTGIDDLIAAIQEEGERTRKTLREEGEKTRETIEGAGRSRGKIGLLFGLATLLISLAALYLQIQESSPAPSHGSGGSTLKGQGPVAPSAAGPAAGGLRLGLPPPPPSGEGRSPGGRVSLQAR